MFSVGRFLGPALGIAVLGALLAAPLVPVYPRAQRADLPRTASGRPNMSGI